MQSFFIHMDNKDWSEWAKALSLCWVHVFSRCDSFDYTDNPLYIIDARYNNKIRYNDNFTVTKPSLKR